MSMKILSPAGDFESLKMAVYNGADEVYLGVKDFNARNIEGFSISSLKEAVDFAHIYDVRVFLAVNILFTDKEIQSALDLIVDAYNLGVDAFIVQDMGLISLIRNHYPEIEIHASTQMGIHNLEGVKEVEKLGVKRVVLSRETSLEEVKRIKQNSKVEIEYFIHGALCVSFSGNCYLSSYLHNASGNRGKCKQLCRLPYDFCFDGKKITSGYLLSAKDFNMLNRLKDLAQAGVDSLKIEGRARRPYYVGQITKTYRNALNNLTADENSVKLAFNRGFTEGYFNGNSDIISDKQNHIGIEVGKVKKFKTGKKFNEIYISSNLEISPKSVLKFINDKEESVVTAYDIKKEQDLYRITTTQKVDVGDSVNLVSDYEKEQKLLNYSFKRNIDIKIFAIENKKIVADISLNNTCIKVQGNVLAKANNQPLNEEDFIRCFNKNEYFKPNLTCEIGNIFISKGELNEFRRKVYEECFKSLTEVNKKPLTKVVLKNTQTQVNAFTNYQFVETLEEKFINKNIIYSPEQYCLENVNEFINKCQHQNKKPLLDLPVFATKKDIQLLDEIINKTKVAIVVNNLYSLNFDTEKIIGGGMNVYNSYTINYYNLPYIQAENAEFKMPYMTMRHCPMKQHLKANCSNCPYKDGYYYRMQSGKKLKLKRKKLNDCTFYLTD